MPIWPIILLFLPVIIYFVLVTIYREYSIYNTPLSLDVADCWPFNYILALSFGTRSDGEALKGNIAIADLVSKVFRHLENSSKHRAIVIMIAQEEIADILGRQYGSYYSSAHTIKSRTDKGKYVGSFDVLVNAIGLKPFLLQDCRTLIIVHPAMYLRVHMLAIELGLDVVIATTQEVYDYRSDQIWTKHPILFWALEPLKYLVDWCRVHNHVFHQERS